MTVTAELSYMQWLKDECGYKDIRPIPGNRMAAIHPLLFTHAIVTMDVGDKAGLANRWCYHTYDKAKAALDAWDGTGEPEGWHRDPFTGRRRTLEGEEEISW